MSNLLENYIIEDEVFAMLTEDEMQFLREAHPHLREKFGEDLIKLEVRYCHDIEEPALSGFMVDVYSRKEVIPAFDTLTSFENAWFFDRMNQYKRIVFTLGFDRE